MSSVLKIKFKYKSFKVFHFICKLDAVFPQKLNFNNSKNVNINKQKLTFFIFQNTQLV